MTEQKENPPLLGDIAQAFSNSYLAECVEQQAKENETLTRRLADLQREYDVSREVLLADIKTGGDRALVLEVENQKLSRDKERLDLLQRMLDKFGNVHVYLWNHDGRRAEDGVMYVHDFSKRGGAKETLRDAIDAEIMRDASHLQLRQPGASPGGQLKTTITQCARCEGSHFDIELTELLNPSEDCTHFAICDTTGQPILVVVDIQPSTEGK